MRVGTNKWIDDEGRLFGRLNLIDLIALVILALIVIRAVVPLWRERPGPMRDAYTRLIVTEVLPEVAAQLRVGESIVESVSGADLGELENKTLLPSETEIAGPDGKLLPALSSRLADMRLQVRGRARKGKGGALEFDHCPLRAGQTVRIQSPRACFTALVIEVGFSGQ